MNNKRLRSLCLQAMTVVVATVSIVGVGYVFAAPTAPPPGSTIPLPLHVGSTAQTKAGALTIQGLLTASAGLTVTGNASVSGSLSAPTICLNGDCKSAWPSGGGGTATTTNTAAYYTGGYCYSGYNYSQMAFYFNGYGYNQPVYNCNATGFSFVVPSNIPSGRTAGAMTSGNVWCQSGPSNYNGYNPPSSYINDSYYQNRVAATVSSITNNNNGTVTISGSCRPADYYGYYYIYMGMRSENVTFSYN